MRNKKNSFLKHTLLILLIAATAVTLPACDKIFPPLGESTAPTEELKEIAITIAVTGPDGTSTEHSVLTFSDNLEGALIDSELVSGEIGPYGLYITTVNGITADFATDGAYWAICKNGEYLMTGAADTMIFDGQHYELVYTVG